MKLPKEIASEAVKCASTAVDIPNVGDLRRIAILAAIDHIARMVVADCANTVESEGQLSDASGLSDDYYGIGMEAGAGMIRERYGLEKT